MRLTPRQGKRVNLFRMAILSLVIVSPSDRLDAQEKGLETSEAAGTRFVVILNGDVVRDTTTGLIWEQSPDLSHHVWIDAFSHCEGKRLGGLEGWRLPTVKELATLIDQEQKDPALPKDHPFANIRSAVYWSSTPSQTDDIVAWHVSFFTGQVVTDQKSQTRRVWCLLRNPLAQSSR
jgi:uncharacterized protein DUF1566